MSRISIAVTLAVLAAVIASPGAQVSRFSPVTTEMLENPSPDDWLMYSRTYDAQRFSPLKQINRQNVNQLKARGRTSSGWGRSKAFRSSTAASCTSSCRAPACARSTRPPAPSIWEYKRARQRPAQDAGDLRRSRVLHRARQHARRARRTNGRRCGGKRRRPAAPRRGRSSSRARC